MEGASELLSCVPVLQIRQAELSCEFYCGVLGFIKEWEHQFEPGFPRLVLMGRGPIRLFLTEHPESAFGTLIYIYVSEVDPLAREFRSRGAQIDLGPITQPWGVREIHLRDPDGNRLRFGQVLDEEDPNG
ncbi:MAG: VOC family protein [Thermostichus sp. BF3_bins_97]